MMIDFPIFREVYLFATINVADFGLAIVVGDKYFDERTHFCTRDIKIQFIFWNFTFWLEEG